MPVVSTQYQRYKKNHFKNANDSNTVKKIYCLDKRWRKILHLVSTSRVCYCGLGFFLEFDNMTAGLPCAKECPCYKDRAPGDCLSFDEFGASLICVNIESNATLAAALNETNDAKGTQDNCKPQIWNNEQTIHWSVKKEKRNAFNDEIYWLFSIRAVICDRHLFPLR